MNVPDFERARRYVIRRLETELPANLYYHGIHHTRDDVLPAVERLADLMGVTGEALLLLRTAALYHDIGYVEQRQGHEKIGVRIAKESLPGFGYHQSQIWIIADLITATHWPQEPHSVLEEIICDADLDTLGREDFFVTSQLLRREMMTYGAEVHLREWHELQLDFLTQHHYFTAAAKALRDEGKRSNIAEIRRLLG
jgi:uncharacterized protein